MELASTSVRFGNLQTQPGRADRREFAQVQNRREFAQVGSGTQVECAHLSDTSGVVVQDVVVFGKEFETKIGDRPQNSARLPQKLEMEMTIDAAAATFYYFYMHRRAAHKACT